MSKGLKGSVLSTARYSSSIQHNFMRRTNKADRYADHSYSDALPDKA